MSRHDLHKAALDVLSAWAHYGTAECLRGWIDRMRDAVANIPPPAPSAQATTECTTCGAVVLGVAAGMAQERARICKAIKSSTN